MSDLTERNYFRHSPAIVNSRYSLTKGESDIIMLLLTAVHKDDEDFKDYHFTKAELERKIGGKINSSELKAQAKSLMSKVLEVETDKNNWELFAWFSYFGYKDGDITCSFDKRLKPYLLELGQFVLGDSRHLLQIKSNYSRRIYMLLKEYRKFGVRKFNVEELQTLLQVPKSLLRYDNFKRRVLKKAEEDINRYTDLLVELVEKKKGRKVVEVIYHIKSNNNEFNEFIKTIRELYVGQSLYLDKVGTLACSKDGLLYYKEDPDIHLTKEKAKEKWEMLFQVRKHLLIFQNDLFSVLSHDGKKMIKEAVEEHNPIYDNPENLTEYEELDRQIWEIERQDPEEGSLLDKKLTKLYEEKEFLVRKI